MHEEVSESTLIHACKMHESVHGSEAIYIKEALKRGSIFKKEGLEPFYALSKQDGTILVTSKENIENKLN